MVKPRLRGCFNGETKLLLGKKRRSLLRKKEERVNHDVMYKGSP